VLVAAAVAGFATALMLWLPAALAILAAAYLLDDTQRAEEETR
jgi:hypothetical protein